MKRLLPVLAAGAVAGPLLLAPGTAWAEPASIPLREAVASLPDGTENRTGYKRDAFKHWTDADKDGCTTRAEVLIEEAVDAPTVGARCKLTGGKWVSYYDEKPQTKTSDLDIDHMVPLAEAWDSGAAEWTPKQRERYANDLDDPRALVAVTDRHNQSKADQDPAQWLPPSQSAHCRYIAEWTAVKHRWKLKADAPEKTALTERAATCPNERIQVNPA
ncbi:uncharacterized protein DUF1524 [Murinocardiopsis flavida]|uniref:Uncharacterized protein DUF1524 n=1 Tax=Murinocardiopsis flavida TaxID=645275 RepID=A0A2P8CVB4_9ACTN|nr:HNH endonuclease family protein [Murinocardiopsis flavida]PSK88913.1 uncharacterized protein DUF1524 [Murinocardiopsis flavida]